MIKAADRTERRLEGYELLASDIVASGISDYYDAGRRACLIAVRYISDMDTPNARKRIDQFTEQMREMKECHIFMHSEWWDFLTELNGPSLEKRLNRRIGEYVNERLSKSAKKAAIENR